MGTSLDIPTISSYGFVLLENISLNVLLGGMISGENEEASVISHQATQDSAAGPFRLRGCDAVFIYVNAAGVAVRYEWDCGPSAYAYAMHTTHRRPRSARGIEQ